MERRVFLLHRNEIPRGRFFFKKKRKRSLQDCGSKRMKHNSVAKLPRLVAPNSPLARLLFYVKWYNKKERKKKKEKAISLIP